jgi:molybdate transport repressor ModE-like protein
MLDIRKLLMLRAVETEGSIAAAARRLQYTRSAVSQQISALERETGARLIERAPGKVVLTSVGRDLIEHTERILVELRAAEAMLASDSRPIAGLLRVGVPFGEGPLVMSRALTQVRRRFPGLQIRLFATSDEAGLDQVRRDLLDMVLVSRLGAAHTRPVPGLREWLLGSDPLRLCVPLDHRLAAADCVEIADLNDESWIFSPSSALGRLAVTMCTTAGFEPTLVASVNDLGTALGLVGLGWGITIAPELTPSQSDHHVARVPLAGVSTERHTVLVVREGEHTSRRLSAAVAVVREISAQSWS